MLRGRQLTLAAAAAWALCACGVEAGNRTLPVVLWHGMGDSCCNVHSIGAVRDRIERALPGQYRARHLSCSLPLICQSTSEVSRSSQVSLFTAWLQAKEQRVTRRAVSLVMLMSRQGCLPAADAHCETL